MLIILKIRILKPESKKVNHNELKKHKKPVIINVKRLFLSLVIRISNLFAAFALRSLRI
ncbi:MAG: hypothetical protein [Olavius algarvensis Delta 4 endosymbiont]|nr:MAG: hypothetical protein [Olavius algarvensis Delta 4 endosymbiont]